MRRALSGSCAPRPRSPRCSNIRSSSTRQLDQETGLETGWKMTGCLRLACNDDRWIEFKRLATTAQSFGMDMHLLVPAGGQSDVAADGSLRSRRRDASCRPTVRPAHPTSRSRWPRAPACTAPRSSKACRVDRFDIEDGRVIAREDQSWPRSLARRSSIAAGNGRARSAPWRVSACRCSRSGINMSSPRRSTALPPTSPTIRDPDRRTYFKEEVGGLVMGGYEPDPHSLDARRRAARISSSSSSKTTGIISSSI